MKVIFSALVITWASITALSSTGCDQQTPGGEFAASNFDYGPAPCPSPGGGNIADCCDPPGFLPDKPLHDYCPGAVLGPPPAGGGPPLPTLPGFSSNDPIERATIQEAVIRALDSDADILERVPGPLAKGAGATAGNVTAPKFAKIGPAGGSGTSNLNFGGNRGGGSGPGGGGGGGGIGGGFNSSGLKTGTLSGSSHPDAMSSSTPSNGDGGAYTQGAGAGGTDGSYGKGNGVWNSGGGDGSGGENGVTTVDMNGTTGSDAAGSKNGTSGSEDPDDYFSRLGMHDNLFKVVERRYTHKARNWVAEDLEKLKMKALK